MPNLNKVMLIGNLTRQPELRYLPSNTAVANIGIAVNRRWKNKQGDQQNETCFVDCEAFGKQAELINQYVNGGDPLYIEGRLKMDQWQDKTSGQKKTKMKVVVENFEFLKGKGDSQGQEKTSWPEPNPAVEKIEPLDDEDIPF